MRILAHVHASLAYLWHMGFEFTVTTSKYMNIVVVNSLNFRVRAHTCINRFGTMHDDMLVIDNVHASTRFKQRNKMQNFVDKTVPVLVHVLQSTVLAQVSCFSASDVDSCRDLPASVENVSLRRSSVGLPLAAISGNNKIFAT